MNLATGCARTLYARNAHPRVLLGPDDVTRLRRQVRTGRGRKIFDAMRRRVAPIIDRMLAADDMPALIADREHKGAFAQLAFAEALNIAMVGALGDDPRAIEAVRRYLGGLVTCEPLLNYVIFIHGRLTNAILAYDLLHDRLPEPERRTFAEYVIANHIRKILADRRAHFLRRAGANLQVDRLLTAIHACLAFRNEPGLPDLAPERDELILFMEAILNTSISSDGYPEEDGGYGTQYLTMIFLAADALRRSGLFDPFRACPRFARAGQMLLHLMPPWGEHLPTTGDCGGTFGIRQYLLPVMARRDRDPALLWVYGHVKDRIEGRSDREVDLDRAGFSVPADAFTLITLDLLTRPVHPAKAKPHPTQFRDRRRGFVTFRSGWDEEATMLIFDGAQRCPAAQGHFHASSGHFSLFALREYFAVDTGRYNMEQDQHNLVLVDGKSGRSTNGEWIQVHHHGLMIDYRPGALCDYAAADSSHQHNAYWARRHIGLVRGGPGAHAYAWTVEDVNKADDWAEFWWTLNTSPTNRIEIEGDRARVIGSRHGHRLEVAFVLPPPEAFPKPHVLALAQDEMVGGSHRYEDPRAAMQKHFAGRPEAMLFHSVHVRPRLIARIGGYNGRFMSLMVPRRTDEPPAQIESIPSLDGTLAARLTFPRFTDTFVFAYEHNLLEADGIVGRGLWCVVRRDRRSRRVIAHELARGLRLSVDGRALKVRREP